MGIEHDIIHSRQCSVPNVSYNNDLSLNKLTLAAQNENRALCEYSRAVEPGDLHLQELDALTAANSEERNR